MTADPYNLAPLERRDKKRFRAGVAEPFPEGPLRMRIRADRFMIEAGDQPIKARERSLEEHAKIHDGTTFSRLESIPGIGAILSMSLLYDIHTIARFPTAADVIAHCQLAPSQRASAGKKTGSGGRNMGNAHPKGVFAQAASRTLRHQTIKERMEKDRAKYGKPGAMRRLSQHLARTVYFRIKKGHLFDTKRVIRA